MKSAIDDVFISYAAIDRDVANQIAQTLDSLGVTYFLDERSIAWGESINDRVRKGLRKCSAIIVILSPASLKSVWVPFEVGFATRNDCLVLPYLTHPSLDRPGYMADLKFLTCLEELREHFDRASNLTEDSTPSLETPFTGRYIAYTWTHGSSTILVEEAVITQRADTVSGKINGVCFLQQEDDGKELRPIIENAGAYSLSGFVDGRLLVMAYRTRLPGQYSAGSITLKAETSGYGLSGFWTGLDGDEQLASTSARWDRVISLPTVENDRHAFIDRAIAGFAAGPLGRWLDVPISVLRKDGGFHFGKLSFGQAGLGKINSALKRFERDHDEKGVTNRCSESLPLSRRRHRRIRPHSRRASLRRRSPNTNTNPNEHSPIQKLWRFPQEAR